MTASRRSVVLVPYHTDIAPHCERSLQACEHANYTVWRCHAEGPIDRARSDIATMALDGGYTELIWVDPDVAFQTEQIRLLQNHNLPFVAGICKADEGHDIVSSTELEHEQLVLGQGGGIRSVRYVGSGFLCTRSEVYEDIRTTYSLPYCDTKFGARTIPFFLPMVISDNGPYWYLSAEYSFCERARNAGHRVLVDTSIEVDRIVNFS